MAASLGTAALGNSLPTIQDTGDTFARNLRVPMELMGIHHQDRTRLNFEGDAVAGDHQQSTSELSQCGEAAESGFQVAAIGVIGRAEVFVDRQSGECRPMNLPILGLPDCGELNDVAVHDPRLEYIVHLVCESADTPKDRRIFK